jgi:glycerol-3-phosphate dehydrogenase
MIEEFNTAIIGGGIVGSGIFRDLSLHNISCVLIDKSDFSSKTSQSSSKMLHGGIRYLENMDFQLVYEALHEKNLWLKIAPHLCFEERFYLPVFNDAKRPLWMIKIGLFLYDLLSGFQNSGHEIKNNLSSIKSIPILKKENLSGCGIYSDAIVDDAKMTLEMIYDALYCSKKSKAYNYFELIEDIEENEFHLITLKNKLNDSVKKIKVKNIVYATGPYTDDLLSKNQHYKWSNILLPSKGSHLWFSQKDIPINHPIVMTTKDDRVIFVIPQNDLVLVGTTEIKTTESYDDLTISESEINYLLNMVNLYFPTLKLSNENILGSFAGVRPLVKEDGNNNLSKTSREHKIVQLSSNSFVIAGGKYTTFRVMGQEITRNIIQKLGKNYNCDLSQKPIFKKSILPSFKFKVPTDAELINICEEELPKTFNDLVIRRIGINSKKIWNYKSNKDFNEFFLSKVAILNKYIMITENDIKNFKEN